MGNVKVNILLLILFWGVGVSVTSGEEDGDNAEEVFQNFTESFYDCIKDENISYDALHTGLKGYHYLRKSYKLKKKQYLTIVDFSIPSDRERLFVIDVAKNQVVHRSLVAHGEESGDRIPTSFSNDHDSHKSSLGFYITGMVYTGKHKESVKLYGQEKSINDKAFFRGVVVHRAEYANRSYLDSNNVLGKSLGCPAVPFKDYDKLVEMIRDGSCLFIYAPDEDYLKASKIVNSKKGYSNFMEAYNS